MKPTFRRLDSVFILGNILCWAHQTELAPTPGNISVSLIFINFNLFKKLDDRQYPFKTLLLCHVFHEGKKRDPILPCPHDRE
jgi:hypothetical protein